MTPQTPIRRFLALVALAALTPLAAAAQDTTRNAVDWDGTYAGILPCASCPGIDVTLDLESDGRYRLAETYQDSGEATFVEQGTFTWNEAGTTITLDDEDKRSFLVTEGSVEMVGADGQPGGDAYRLSKAVDKGGPVPQESTRFVGDGANLVIDDASVETETRDGAPHVLFDSLHNFERAMEGGHQSMLVRYDINCADRTVAMPDVSYFEKPDGAGKMLAEAHGQDDWLPIVEEREDVVRQAADRFCD